jgi:hypothetical protein
MAWHGYHIPSPRWPRASPSLARMRRRLGRDETSGATPTTRDVASRCHHRPERTQTPQALYSHKLARGSDGGAVVGWTSFSNDVAIRAAVHGAVPFFQSILGARLMM